MLRLTTEQCREMDAILPPASLAFLRDRGVPEALDFRGVDHVFAISMEPLLNGNVFRLGSVDHGSYSMGIERITGHFGYVFSESMQPPWCFANSSLECFLTCFEAAERLWELETANQIAWEARGEFLELEIRRIDPVVLADKENIWSCLVEELRAGVV
jgi:hypothetical protein